MIVRIVWLKYRQRSWAVSFPFILGDPDVADFSPLSNRLGSKHRLRAELDSFICLFVLVSVHLGGLVFRPPIDVPRVRDREEEGRDEDNRFNFWGNAGPMGRGID